MHSSGTRRTRIDDLGRESTFSRRPRSRGILYLRKPALVSGEYTLTAVGPEIISDRDYVIQLIRPTLRGDDVVSTRSTISKGIIEPNGTIEPARFTLLVPEPGGWLLILAGLSLCVVARRSRCSM